MQYTATGTRELESPPYAPRLDDRFSREARAWLRRRLSWERRLAELRTRAECDHRLQTATRDGDAAARAPR